MTDRGLLLRIRWWLGFFVVGLVVSGVTAFPLVHEVNLLHAVVADPSLPFVEHVPGLVNWIARVRAGLVDTGERYPFIAYGTDWLAFAHLVIAVAFWGPWRDPVRNIWVVQFGMIACLGIIPLALIAGPVRGIPFWWSVLDMSFGVIGIIPLLVVHRLIRRLEFLRQSDSTVTAGVLAGDHEIPTAAR